MGHLPKRLTCCSDGVGNQGAEAVVILGQERESRVHQIIFFSTVIRFQAPTEAGSRAAALLSARSAPSCRGEGGRPTMWHGLADHLRREKVFEDGRWHGRVVGGGARTVQVVQALLLRDQPIIQVPLTPRSALRKPLILSRLPRPCAFLVAVTTPSVAARCNRLNPLPKRACTRSSRPSCIRAIVLRP